MSLPPRLVAVGLVAQAALLVPLAGLGPRAAACLAAGASLAAILALAAWPRLAASARGSLAMLAGGGLGMTLGWWADLDFASAAALLRSAPGAAAGAWCGLAPLAGEGPHAAPRLHLLSWMNAGMLAGGALSLRGARGGGHAHPGAALLDALGMVLGMSAGGLLAARTGAALPAEAAVVAAHGLMNGGMLAGMQLAALARIAAARVPARRRRSPALATGG